MNPDPAGDPFSSRQGGGLPPAATRGEADRSQAATELWLSHQRLQALVAHSWDILSILDETGRLLYNSPACERIHGYTSEELLGRSTVDLIHPEDAPRVAETMSWILAHPGESASVEYRYSCKDGRWIWMEAVAVNFLDNPSVQGIVANSRDVSERKRIEAALRESEERYRGLFEHAAIGVYRTTPDGRILLVNPAALSMLGFRSFEELAERNLERGGFEPSYARSEFRRLAEQEGGLQGLEASWTRQDGTVLYVRESARAVRDANGSVLYFEGTIEDITDRKRSEEALQEALVFNEQIISSAQEGIVVYDLEGRFVFINHYLESLSGMASKDVAGKPAAEVLAFGETSGVTAGIRRALQGEMVVNPPFAWSFPMTGRSGWATSTQAPLMGRHGEIIGVIETVTDLTELHQIQELQYKLEAELHQNQKLESLGSLAGGIAHDMNNVLSAIQAMTETLKATHAVEDQLVIALDIIERASTRGRDLVKSLTNFARKDLREPGLLDMNVLVREEVEILRRTTLQKVDLILDLEEPLGWVMGERGTLGSALMNLCVNAVDAMPEGGALTLRTRNLEGPMVELAVEDSGEGMHVHVLNRALEPFFTTKPAGKGTGLGLSMVYATVRAHGGTVSLQSELGKGTSVRVRLPVSAQPGQHGEPTEPRPVASASRMILLVDDDELIRATVPSLLEVLGHRVIVASGGEEALHLLASRPDVELVMLDLNMPGMNGAETLKHIRRMRADLPVLIAMGYLDPETAELIQQAGSTLSIAKPFSMKELARKLDEF